MDNFTNYTSFEKDKVRVEEEIIALKKKCSKLRHAMIGLFILIVIISIIVGATACGLYFLFVWVPICGAAIITILILLIIWRKHKKELAIKEKETK